MISPANPLLFTLALVIALSPVLSFGGAMTRVPAGTFEMGCSVRDRLCEDDEGPRAGTTVDVPEFLIDRYEVSVAEYRVCIDEGVCTRPDDHQSNRYCNYGAAEREDHPVNCVDWPQAVEYCRWKNARLPTEAEWEKAARAGSLTPFPWGSDVSCKKAILNDGVTLGSAGTEPNGCGEDRTWPRGSLRPNSLGLYDMHGNVSEWVFNWYKRDAVVSLYAKGDLLGPQRGRQRVVKGGAWNDKRVKLRSSYRGVKPPVSGKSVYSSIGFRCTASR